MSKLKTIEDLLMFEIKDLYSAETQLVKALPKMANAASDPDLRAGFENHLKETEMHVDRLEKVATFLDFSPKGKSCKAMKGLIEEGSEVIDENGDPAVKDLALIVAAQKVEHYEIAAYGHLQTLAVVLGYSEAAELLQMTLDEEGATDKKLTKLSLRLIPEAGAIEA